MMRMGNKGFNATGIVIWFTIAVFSVASMTHFADSRLADSMAQSSIELFTFGFGALGLLSFAMVLHSVFTGRSR